jgi:hypothetical protein
MRILHFAQKGTDGNPSDDFFQEHLGRATASSAASILDFTQKGVEGSKRRLYRLEKVAEILSGIAAQDHFVSPAMRAGTAAEPKARVAYELEEKIMVEETGIVIGDDERTAWSPDGLISDAEGNLVGAIECKGPRTTTHLQSLDDGKIPDGNMPQLIFAFMVCPPLQWIDFVSRDGGMSNDAAMFGEILPRRYVQFTIRVHRSEVEPQIAKMREATDLFLADVDATIARLNDRCPALPDAPDIAPEGIAEWGISDEDINAADPNWRGGNHVDNE